MNLAALLTACCKALSGAADWHEDINISQKGFLESYLAIALSIPAYYICALAITTQRALIDGTERSAPPLVLFATVALIYSLAFSVSAYFICRFFNKKTQFAPWVIARHWSFFFCVLLTATLYGFFLLGMLPFGAANYAALGIYLATLMIDIRLANKLGSLDIGTSIFAACIIFAAGLSILLFGVTKIGGQM